MLRSLAEAGFDPYIYVLLANDSREEQNTVEVTLIGAGRDELRRLVATLDDYEDVQTQVESNAILRVW